MNQQFKMQSQCWKINRSYYFDVDIIIVGTEFWTAQVQVLTPSLTTYVTEQVTKSFHISFSVSIKWGQKKSPTRIL